MAWRAIMASAVAGPGSMTGPMWTPSAPPTLERMLAYRIPGLPFTAIIGLDGTLLVRHPGTFSAEQLEYIIQTLQHR